MSRVLAMVNRLGALGRRAGLTLTSLDPERLIAEAQQLAGLDDLGETPWREGFDALVASLDGEARLNTVGRFHARKLVVQALVTRLRLVERRAQGLPEVAHPPLIVCGPPRTGTTFLHRMLVEARPEARALPFWELIDPLPGPGPDRRMDEARSRLRRLAQVAPDLDAQHLIRPELPDECGHLFKPAFLSAHFWQAPAFGYMEWWLDADASGPYVDYRDLLACLEPSRPLVLKDPFHVRHLDALFAVLPDAMVVRTSRDPVEVVPSFHKLVTTMHRVFSDEADLERSIDLNTRLVIDTARITDPRVLPVDYRDLVADPAGVVTRIHAHFGLSLDEEALARFVADHPAGRHGPNPYRPEDFGQTPDAIRARFEEAGAPCR